MKQNSSRIGQGTSVAVLVFAALLAAPLQARSQRAAVAMNVSEEYLKAAADAERAALGLPPLRFDDSLAAAARRHAAVMVEHNSISHKYAEEPDLAARAAAEGARFSLISENVAQAPNAVKIHVAWMHSEAHRHNLLDPNVDSIGISVIGRRGQMFAVEDFARTVNQLSLQEQESEVASRLRTYGLSLEAPGGEAYRMCMNGANTDAAHEPDFIMRYTTTDLDELPKQLLTRLETKRYGRVEVAACALDAGEEFSMYRIAVLLFR